MLLFGRSPRFPTLRYNSTHSRAEPAICYLALNRARFLDMIHFRRAGTRELSVWGEEEVLDVYARTNKDEGWT